MGCYKCDGKACRRCVNPAKMPVRNRIGVVLYVLAPFLVWAALVWLGYNLARILWALIS